LKAKFGYFIGFLPENKVATWVWWVLAVRALVSIAVLWPLKGERQVSARLVGQGGFWLVLMTISTTCLAGPCRDEHHLKTSVCQVVKDHNSCFAQLLLTGDVNQSVSVSFAAGGDITGLCNGNLTIGVVGINNGLCKDASGHADKLARYALVARGTLSTVPQESISPLCWQIHAHPSQTCRLQVEVACQGNNGADAGAHAAKW
jgi:hypothetical protein